MSPSARGIQKSASDERCEEEQARLERKVGQLVVENDWLKKVQAAGSRSMRKAMVEKENKELSIRRQCELLDINLNRLEMAGKAGGGALEDLKLARKIDKLHLQFPEFGSRRMSEWFRRQGDRTVSWRRVGRVMKAMGVCAVYRRPQTSIPAGVVSAKYF